MTRDDECMRWLFHTAVETIGDGCVMAAGLIDRDGEPKNDKANARRALAIAEDMIRAARKVRPPLNRHGERPPFIEIRVGIHQGDITCGVLGKLQPRFQVFGLRLHPAPCTLHPAPCTLHPAPCTLHTTLRKPRFRVFCV